MAQWWSVIQLVGMVVLLFLPQPAVGAESDLVEVLGPLDFEMVPGPQGCAAPLRIPVRIGAEGPPDLLVVDSITLGGKVQPGRRDGFRAMLRGAGELRELVVHVAPERIAETGTYGIRLRAVRTGSLVRIQTLSLTLTRPTAVLHTLPTLRLEVVHGAGRTRLSPANLLLTETSGKAELHDLVALPVGELQGPGDRPLEARLRLVPVRTPLSLAPLEQKQVPVRIEGDLPLGTTTGTLSFISPQLAVPHTVAVQIVTRVWTGWLLITLLASLALGWLVRVWLEKRRLVLEAGIAARRQVEVLLDLATRQVDSDLQDQLREEATALEQEIDALDGDPAALKTSLARAAQAAEQRLREAEGRRGELRTRIAELRRRLGTPEGQDIELRVLIERTASELDRQERELSSGAVGAVAIAVEDLEQRLPIRCLETAIRWKADLEAGLERVTSSPGTPFGAAVEELRKELAEFDETKDGKDDLPQLLAWGRRIAFLVRQRVLGAGVAAVEIEAERTAQILPREGGPAQRVEAALATLRSRPRTGPEAVQLRAAVQAVRELQEAMAEAVRSQAPQPAPPSVEEALGRGEYPRAAELAVQGRDRSDRSRRVLSGSDPVPALEVVRRPSLADPLQPSLEESRTFSVSIDAPPSPVAGRPASFRLRIHGELPSRYTVRWSAGGEAEGEGQSTGLLWRFRPRFPGPLLVRSEIRDLDGGVAAAEALVEVRPPRSTVPLLERRLGWTESLQSAVVGLLVAGAGYLIFQRDFIGTFQDFFLAAVWGFTVDAGVSKLREMATPVLGRPVPLPKNEADGI